MTDPATAYFFKKYYRNIIKWWFVVYNPDYKKVWPSKEEEEIAHQKELEEERIAHEKELEEAAYVEQDKTSDDAFNASTGSYSGLYGQKPVDDKTQSTLDEILNAASSQCNIDSLVAATKSGDVTLPPEQDEIIKEANAIYERLLREAAEDEAKKQAEIEAARHAFENKTQES